MGDFQLFFLMLQRNRNLNKINIHFKKLWQFNYIYFGDDNQKHVIMKSLINTIV